MVSGSRLWYPDQDKWISKSKHMKYYVYHTSLIRAFYMSTTSNDDYEINNPDTRVLNYLVKDYYANDFTVQRYANKILCPDDDWSVFSPSDKRFLTDTALSIAAYITITQVVLYLRQCAHIAIQYPDNTQYRYLSGAVLADYSEILAEKMYTLGSVLKHRLSDEIFPVHVSDSTIKSILLGGPEFSGIDTGLPAIQISAPVRKLFLQPRRESRNLIEIMMSEHTDASDRKCLCEKCNTDEWNRLLTSMCDLDDPASPFTLIAGEKDHDTCDVHNYLMRYPFKPERYDGYMYASAKDAYAYTEWRDEVLAYLSARSLSHVASIIENICKNLSYIGSGTEHWRSQPMNDASKKTAEKGFENAYSNLSQFLKQDDLAVGLMKKMGM
jgi:hypothetical protein